MDDQITTTAARQRGFITTAQLTSMGVTEEERRRLRASGLLTHVRRCVHLVGRHRHFDLEDRAMVACLKVGGLVCASGLTAARLWGLWSAPDMEAIEISVRYPRTPRLDNVVVHRSRDLVPAHRTTLSAVPVTTPERTLVDVGRVLPGSEVLRLTEHAVATGLVARGRLVQQRIETRKQGRNGTGVMESVLRALADDTERTESGREAATIRLLRDHGLPDPTPQVWVRCGTRRYRLDLAYPEQRIAIEYDGRQWHSSETDQASDRRREAALVATGWVVIRATNSDLQLGGAAVLAEAVRQALRRRAA